MSHPTTTTELPIRAMKPNGKQEMALVAKYSFSFQKLYIVQVSRPGRAEAAQGCAAVPELSRIVGKGSL